MQTVLITGGSSGIGSETVRIFYDDGFRVYFTYRSGKEKSIKLIKEVSGENSDDRLIPLRWDAGNRDSLDELISGIKHPVDVLINNAGVGSATVKNITEDSFEQDHQMMMINSVAPLWLIKKILPGMKERGGKIVNVSSVGGGITQFPNFTTADGMSKAALAFMTRQLAAELAHDPVDVFAICPGAVETPMFGASTLDHLSEKDRSALIQKLPGNRLISPLEVARIIRYLSKPEASIMRGAVIDASLGLGSNPGLLQA